MPCFWIWQLPLLSGGRFNTAHFPSRYSMLNNHHTRQARIREELVCGRYAAFDTEQRALQKDG